MRHEVAEGQDTANGIRIAWEMHGPADDPVILLVHGLGVPLAGWPPGLIERLVTGGYRVLTFDNRDIGRSELMTSAGVPNPGMQWLRSRIGLRIQAPYHLDDMRGDTVALLDALGIDTAHVVGVSMGGMIAQLTALDAPQRVASLTSIMSTTGNRRLPGPTREVRQHMLSRPTGSDIDARLVHGIRTWELIGSPSYRKSRADLEAFLRNLYARGVTPAGVLRQMVAIMAAPARNERLRALDLPALVIHGAADPLVPLPCGQDTATAIPGSRLRVFEGMGHDLPEALLPDIADAIVEHISEAGQGSCRAA